MVERETKASLKNDLAECEKESSKWEKKYDKAHIAARSKKESEAACTVLMALAQTRYDRSAIYRVVENDNPDFIVGDITTAPGFLPDDPDFNFPFLDTKADDKKMQAKQAEFSKYMKLEVRIGFLEE